MLLKGVDFKYFFFKQYFVVGMGFILDIQVEGWEKEGSGKEKIIYFQVVSIVGE